MSNDFARRSAVYLARMNALTAAAGRERTFRSRVNLGTYFTALAIIVFQWATFDVRWLFGVVVGAAVVRTIGNGLVTVWCDREIARIKAALPLDGQEETP